MATIVLRATKGSPLTNTEVDANFNNINVEVGTKLTASTYTATDILTKLKTVDGPLSGLDADTLDGHSYSASAPGSFVVSSVSRTSNVNTIVAATAHGFTAGQIVKLYGVSDPTFNGSYTILAGGLTSLNFTYTQTGSNVVSTAQTRALCYVAITDISIPARNASGVLTSPTIVALTTYSNLVGNVTGSVTGDILGNAVNVSGTVAIANGGTGGTTTSTARANLGLGSIATQSSASVNITGGSISGLTTDLAIADGGTGANTAQLARSNLGLAIGSNVQAYDGDLLAIAALTVAGMYVKTGSNTATTRTITGSASDIIVTNGTGVSGNPTISVGSNVPKKNEYTAFTATSALKMPVGTTAQRPATPVVGDLRFNSSLTQYEGYSGSAWGSIGGGATGGLGDAVFVENSQDVTQSYTITTGKNAMCTGPININSGVIVTVPTGSRWIVI